MLLLVVLLLVVVLVLVVVVDDVLLVGEVVVAGTVVDTAAVSVGSALLPLEQAVTAASNSAAAKVGTRGVRTIDRLRMCEE